MIYRFISTITQYLALTSFLVLASSCGNQSKFAPSDCQAQKSCSSPKTSSPKKYEGPPYFVLSIDGGGIRGVILARILKDIEEKTQKRIHQLFDIFTGTSTGGLLSLLLTLPRYTGEQKEPMTAEEAGRFYFAHRELIFQYACKWYVPKLACSLKGPMYKADGIEQLIRGLYPNQLFNSALKPVVLTAFDIEARQGVSLESDLPYQNLTVLEAGRSTSAAPTYFPPIKVKLAKENRQTSDVWLVDGGLYKNNPALLGYDKAEQLFGANNVKERGLVLISIGTGVNSENPHNGNALVEAGAATWGHAVVDAMMAGASNEDETTLQTIFATLENSKYIRIQTELNNKDYPSIADLDNTSEKNIGLLLNAAENTLQSELYQEALQILLKYF